eukprot:TRINITY_DN75058_c0_g1_i1.p1 TRINITY_DN75058_c0_g1~~TRINITY_DN75058_c0_g1_i1.p1  ORF type:complete len:663 (-),score=201.17 TRINITY_DN75058_c0_g1_i1:122-2110(-)
MAPKEEGGYPAGAEGEKKEKKPRPAPPAPPAAVATASLIIRAAAARVLGLKPGVAGGDLQPIWVTEEGCSKVTIALDGSSRTPFPQKDEEHKLLIDAIEKEVCELVKADAPISVQPGDRAELEGKFGDVMAAPSKGAKAPEMLVAYVPDALFAEVPPNWTLCSSTAAAGAVTILGKSAEKEGKKPETMILAKKKQLMIKFNAANKDAAGAAKQGALPEADAVKAVNTGEVRVQVEGVDTKPEVTIAAAAEVVEEAAAGDEAVTVNPWEVTGKVDYEKLTRDFGSSLIDQKLLERMERLTVGAGRVPHLHRWLRRGVFYSHRDMNQLLDCFEKGKPFYLYTGRGPASVAMHLGHLLPFMMTKWLQDAFNVPLVIQMTDDEKFLWKGGYDPEKGDDLMRFRGMTTENVKDIIAVGFDKKKTFIFSDLEYVGEMYPNIVRIWKSITYSTARGAFGFDGASNIGQSAFPAIQAAPSFPSSFKTPLGGDDKMACLIPCAIDQDPYFRVTRDIAHKLVPKDHPLKGKPSLIHSKFFPPLQGVSGKMSGSNENSAIYLADGPELIEKKVMNYALSGGQQTAKEQREKGADLEVDVAYQWLRFFLEDDDELAHIAKEYGSGQGETYWSTGQVKKRLVVELQKIVKEHQDRRAKITDEEVAEWMRVRKLDF